MLSETASRFSCKRKPWFAIVCSQVPFDAAMKQTISTTLCLISSSFEFCLISKPAFKHKTHKILCRLLFPEMGSNGDHYFTLHIFDVGVLVLACRFDPGLSWIPAVVTWLHLHWPSIGSWLRFSVSCHLFRVSERFVVVQCLQKYKSFAYFSWMIYLWIAGNRKQRNYILLLATPQLKKEIYQLTNSMFRTLGIALLGQLLKYAKVSKDNSCYSFVKLRHY